jgi:dienelactone hydrolase
MRFTRAALLILPFLVACGGSSGGDGGSPAPAPPPAENPPPPQRGQVAIEFAQADAPVTKLQWGEPFYVRASGFIPGEEVTLHALAVLRDGPYASDAIFVADAQGKIDTSKDAPKSGSYDGADADGLMWSMKPTKESAGDLARYDFRVKALVKDAGALATGTLARWYQAPNVVRTAVTDDGLVGAYYADPNGGKKPVIVAFGGSEGGLSTGDNLAAYWASRGYTALGLAYFAATGVPADLVKIPLEYFEKAFAWLDKQPEADATKLCVMGGSRGGELALLLGSTFPRISCVVAEVPSGVSWSAPLSIASETASWTYQGNEIPWLPYLKFATAEDYKTADGQKASSYRKSFADAVAAAAPDVLAAATFQVEKTNGPVLMIGGADDQVWPSCDLMKISMDRLVAAGHTSKYADDSQCYAASGHASGLIPGVPTTADVAIVHPLSGELLALGGTPAGMAKAQRDFLARTTSFLTKALR